MRISGQGNRGIQYAVPYQRRARHPGLSIRAGGQDTYAQMLSLLASTAALYDPSDLTSLYQSRTGGSTGAADAVVGIMLDKRQMGNKTAASFIAGQSELASLAAFDKRAATDGTRTVLESGVVQFTNAAASLSTGISAQMSFTSGEWYRFQATVRLVSGGPDVLVDVRDGSGGGGSSVVSNGVSSTSTSFTTLTVVWRASATTLHPTIRAANNSVFEVQSVSVKAIPGSHALAPSDSARPILRVASGLSYLDCDGTDDWMNVLPTLNLGEQWAHVGGWQADTTNGYAFATSANFRGGIRTVATYYGIRDAADAGTSAFTGTGTLTSPNVLTAEQTATNLIAGRINGAAAGSVAPFNDSGSAQGLALFSSVNGSYNAGLDGRFYGGLWTPGSMSSGLRSLAERWAASKCGVSL